jgi:methylmalonyl-CoA/ethylmalonyl-CoA epimerase
MIMKNRIHHVGLAVRNIEEAAGFFEEVFDAELTAYTLETPEFFSRMLTIGQGLFELLEPRGRDGLIERFLKNKGEGIHHVSIQVEDLGKVLATCKEKGFALLGNRFIHPKSTHGVLVELIEIKEKEQS